MAEAALRTRRFTAEDQERFAALSGDRNPMHMDAAAARRTQAGVPVVHGVAVLLWALDALAAEGLLAAPAALRVEFQGFVPVGAAVALAVRDRGPDRLRAEIAGEGTRAVAIDLRFGKPGPAAAWQAGAPEQVPETAQERGFEELDGAAGALLAPVRAAERAAALYPALSETLGPERVASVALVSSLVGMVAPGLHSIFSGLSLGFAAPGPGSPALAWRVARADERFRLLTLDIAAPGFGGSVRAFARFPPVEPPSFAAAAARVEPGAFAGRHALVIGGSRGLGTATALLLAAGGAEVTLTYRSGRAEAEALAGEIARNGGRAAAISYDAEAPAGPQLAGLPPVDDLFYFATGQIFGAAGGIYRRARLERFLAVYADGFAAAVEALVAPERPLRAFYPSSVAVETRPAGMTEYAMAKAAGEILARDLARAHRSLTVEVHRLPRILTDQTATVPPVPAEDPLDVMARLLARPG